MESVHGGLGLTAMPREALRACNPRQRSLHPVEVCSNGNRDEARQACQDPQELRGGMAGKMEY